jgi:hypothetical protein
LLDLKGEEMTCFGGTYYITYSNNKISPPPSLKNRKDKRKARQMKETRK